MRKIKGFLKYLVFATLMIACGTVFAAELTQNVKLQLRIEPAKHTNVVTNARITAATLAGKRIVAVGEHGLVLLSDDYGKTYRQARTMPIGSMLTAVSFVDERTGWAVGHWGAIVKTIDGGETWTLQRSDINVDQPLFSVYFKNNQEGLAVGQWSLMIQTVDGGAKWTVVKLPPSPGQKKFDRNLYDIFSDSKGDLFIACEKGIVLRSTDGGKTWAYIETGFNGSFWTGIALKDGTLMVGGLLGKIYRSVDRGKTWRLVKTPLDSFVTDIIQLVDQRVVAVGLDGAWMESKDGGKTFTGKNLPDQTALTAVVEAKDGTTVLFSTSGPKRN